MADHKAFTNRTFQTDAAAVCLSPLPPPRPDVDMEKQALRRAREAFQTGRTRPVDFRLQQLQQLQKMITEKEGEICTALKQDINRVGGALQAEFLRDMV